MHASVLWTGLIWVWTASEVALVVATHTRSTDGGTHDRESIFLLWIAIVASVSAAGWTHDGLPAANFSGSPWLKPLPIALMAVGLVIRWTAILSLGKSFSVNVAIHASQTVYREGLYHLVGHPSYLRMLFIFLAIGLRSHNWVGLAVILIAPSAALLYRIQVEEAALETAFGPEYTAIEKSPSASSPASSDANHPAQHSRCQYSSRLRRRRFVYPPDPPHTSKAATR